jgi:methionyl-tRNA formyltransferase
MQVVKEMDAGAVADVEVVHIGELDTGPALRAKVGEAVVPLLRRNLTALLAGELSLTEQDLSKVTYCRKMRKEDGAIDFSLSAMEIYNRLRAFSSWPGGYFDHGESRIKVGRASVAADELSSAAPGIVLSTGSEVRVATSAGDICFHELQRPGARMLPAADFLRGYPIVAGDLLMGSLAEPLVRQGS